MFTIGPWQIRQPTVLAPMAGVSDEPFRQICRQLGVGMTVSEMLTSDKRLWTSRKSKQRLFSDKENMTEQPRSLQLAGNDPQIMAEAAKAGQDAGADIIDLNMGCPAKKVCNKAAGSALLQDERLVERILSSVASAVEIPVTLKIRTGWNPEQRNGVTIAKMAEQTGIQALAVHGRTRACAFKGEAEYDTIAAIVETVSIPVIANGDITSPQKARAVIEHTNASGVMIGRGAQGNPWIFQEINDYLTTGKLTPKPTSNEIYRIIKLHLSALHDFYGELQGVRIARKHIGWYLKQQTQFTEIEQQFRHNFNRLECAQAQHKAITNFFNQQSLTTKEFKGDIAA